MTKFWKGVMSMGHVDRTPLVSEVIICILFCILLCAPMLDAMYGGVFSYADEVVTLLLVGWAIASNVSNKTGEDERRAIAALLVMCCIGVAGNIVYGVQESFFAVAVDMFTCVKVFICYLSARVLLKEKERCISFFCAAGKVFLACAGLGLLLHVTGLAQLGSGREMLGVPCYQFLFSHPTNLAAYCVGLSALYFVGPRPQRVWIVLACVLLVATQRAKAFAIAFVILFFLLYNLAGKDDRSPSKLVFAILTLGALVLGLDQIKEYFFSSTAARALLTQDSVRIAASFFPLGAGFATFATYMSGAFYSPLYFEYGLDEIWGLWPSNPTFVSDSFWPAVLGQLGVFGLLVVLFLMRVSFRSISVDSKKSGIRFAAYGIIPIYLLILSTSDASFFNFYGPFYALVLGAIINHSESSKTVAETQAGS